VKILIGLDDSTHSKQALDMVARMRWPAGSTVLLVTVQRPSFGKPSTRHNEQRRKNEEFLSAAAGRPREAGLSTETKVLDGDPRDLLVTTACNERCDLVVVGSHGRTGLARLLLGSVASHVVTHAPCSVMVVKKPAGNT
jgi:nucleotide-binding universal stress UspA family protein